MANLTLQSCYILDTLVCGLLPGETRTVAKHPQARPVYVSRIDRDRIRVDFRHEVNGTTLDNPSFMVRNTRSGYAIVSLQLYAFRIDGRRIDATAQTLHFDAISPGHVRALDTALTNAKKMHGLTVDAGPRCIGANF